MHDRGILVIKAFVHTGVLLYKEVMKRLAEVQPVGGETKDQLFVRYMLSVGGQTTFVSLFQTHYENAVNFPRQFEKEFNLDLARGRYMFYFDEPINLRGSALGVFMHLLHNRTQAFAPEDFVPSPESAPPARLLDSEEERVALANPHSPSVRTPVFATPRRPTVASPSTTYSQTADAFYGIRLVMLQLRDFLQTIVIAGTSSDSWRYFKTEMTSPLRDALRSFTDIPLLTADLIAWYLREHFSFDEDLVARIALTFAGRAFFFFVAFLHGSLLPKLRETYTLEMIPAIVTAAIADGVAQSKEAIRKLLLAYSSQEQRETILKGEVLCASVLCNGNFTFLPKNVEHPMVHVVRGLSYLNESDKTIRIAETFVRQVLLDIALEEPRTLHHYLCDEARRTINVNPDTTFTGNLIERVLAFILLQQHTKPSLFKTLPGIVSSHPDDWSGFRLALAPVTECGTFKQLDITAFSMAECRPSRMMYPDTLCGPDLILTPQDEKAAPVNCFIQSRAYRKRLSNAEFVKALLTLNPGGFYRTNDARQMLVNENKVESTDQKANLFHSTFQPLQRAVRIVFSLCGFNDSTIRSVNRYNSTPDGLNFPIVLLNGNQALLGDFLQYCSVSEPLQDNRRAMIPVRSLRFVQVGEGVLSPPQSDLSSGRRTSKRKVTPSSASQASSKRAPSWQDTLRKK